MPVWKGLQKNGGGLKVQTRVTGLLTSTRAEGRKERRSFRFVSGVFSVLSQWEIGLEGRGGEGKGGGKRKELDTQV